MIIFTVPAGDTLSQIGVQYGVSYESIASANHLQDPNLIYAGEKLVIPSGGSWAPAPAQSAPQQPQQPSYQPSNPQPVSSAGGVSIPGMPQGLANCIWQRESTSGTNPAANGNQFGIIPASGYNVAGDSVAQQEQTAGQIYAQSGGQAWAADGCPGT